MARTMATELTRLLGSHNQRMDGWDSCGGVGTVEPNAVFCNRELRMSNVDWVGCDYDFTLASYSGLGPLIFDLAKEHLVGVMGYPDGLRRVAYQPGWATRGVAFDTARGLFLKLDPYHYIDDSCVFLGHSRLSREQVAALYSSSCHLPNDYLASNVEFMHDLFCLPELQMIAAIIEMFRERSVTYDPSYVHADVRQAIDAVHTGAAAPGMHRAIMDTPSAYLRREPELKDLLLDMRNSGKKTFLLTNSPFAFVDAGMSFITDDPEWGNLFDVIVCAASKPAFFESERPFRRLWAPHTGSNELSWTPVTSFEQGAVYVQGCISAFHKLAGITSPDRVLYVGDNLPSDLVSPSRKHSWRTMAIVRELESEIAVTNSREAVRLEGRLAELKHTISQLTDALRFAPTSEAADWHDAIGQLRSEHRATEEALAALHNPTFGPTMRARDQVSHFAAAVNKYADIYSASVTNLGRYGFEYEFHPRVQRSQHESEPDVSVCRPEALAAFDSPLPVARYT